MATVRHLGLFPKTCFPYKNRNELKWRTLNLDEVILEVDAPDEAYLIMTKDQAFFAFWRVKEWEISWGWNSKLISKTIDLNYRIDGEIYQTEVLSFEFSYPLASFSKILPAPHLTEFDLLSSDEKELVCKFWSGAVPSSNIFDLNTLSIFSSWTSSADDPPNSVISNGSRDTITNSVLTGNASTYQQEVFYDFDFGWVSNENGLLYWPFCVDINIVISDVTTNDGILFDEDSFFGPNGLEQDGFVVEGTLPPIRGFLTTFSRPFMSTTSTSYYAKIEFPNGTEIKLPLFDASTPSPRTNTKFNIDGFTGITIKPKSYWPYDPNDGGGPIYDSETGAQIRSF
jgi:hypothetical protein